MIRIKFEHQSARVAISLDYAISGDQREYRLERSMDEPLGDSMKRLKHHLLKQIRVEYNRLAKLREKQGGVIDAELSRLALSDDPVDGLVMRLIDPSSGSTVSLETLNRDAWKEGHLFHIDDMAFTVVIDLPAIKKINLSHRLIVGMPTIVKFEIEPEYDEMKINTYSLVTWYRTDQAVEHDMLEKWRKLKPKKTHLAKGEDKHIHDYFDSLTWIKLAECGAGVKCIVLDDECAGKLIKCHCTP